MKNFYYIRGSKTNSRGVKAAIKKVRPDIDISNCCFFGGEDVLYYIFNDEVRTAWDDSDISDIIKALGTEIQPSSSIEENTEFRLPTKEEFENLNRYFSRWSDEKKGLEIMTDSGDILFFPACGYLDGISNCYVGSYGYYCSSTVYESDSYFIYRFYFGSRGTSVDCSGRQQARSVRLVSDTSFDGGIEFDGVWWKPENENGYFTFDEVISKFNK